MAQQFQSPETYATGQQLTAARLNNMVNNAVPLPGLITDRTALTVNTVASDDKFLIVDTSASAIRSINASDILGSGIPINTSSISYGAQDIYVDVSSSTPITTASFVSSDGNTVTVTATAHGFTGASTHLIEVSGAPSSYNGIFVFNYVDANTFTYTTHTTGTPVTSPTVITVRRRGAFYNASSIVTGAYLSVVGLSIFNSVVYAKSTLNVTGALTCSSTASIAGNTTISGNLNVVGTTQKNGTNLYGLYSIAKVEMTSETWQSAAHGRYTYSGTWYLTTGRTLYTESFTVPTGEIWEINYTTAFFVNGTMDDAYAVAWLKNGALESNSNFGSEYDLTAGYLNSVAVKTTTPIPFSTILTSGTNTITLKFGVFTGSGSQDAVNMGGKTFTPFYIIRKYKT